MVGEDNGVINRIGGLENAVNKIQHQMNHLQRQMNHLERVILRRLPEVSAFEMEFQIIEIENDLKFSILFCSLTRVILIQLPHLCQRWKWKVLTLIHQNYQTHQHRPMSMIVLMGITAL